MTGLAEPEFMFNIRGGGEVTVETVEASGLKEILKQELDYSKYEEAVLNEN